MVNDFSPRRTIQDEHLGFRCHCRYDRDLWVKTVRAIKTIDKIRQTRTERFHKARLAKMTKVHRTLAEKEIAKHKHLLEEPSRGSSVRVLGVGGVEFREVEVRVVQGVWIF